MGQFGLWIESRGDVPGVARTERRPDAPAERARGPAPTEANPRRRPKPIPRAERSQSPRADRSQFPRLLTEPDRSLAATHRRGRGCPRSHAPRGDGSPAAPRRPIRGGRGAAEEAFRRGASERGTVGFGETSPFPRAERSQFPAPSEANSSRRAKPIPHADRSQFLAPSGPEPRRRPNPGVRLWFAAMRLRAGRGRDVQPRAACDLIIKEHPISSQLDAPAFSESAAGSEVAPPDGPGRGSWASNRPTTDDGRPGWRRADGHAGEGKCRAQSKRQSARMRCIAFFALRPPCHARRAMERPGRLGGRPGRSRWLRRSGPPLRRWPSRAGPS